MMAVDVVNVIISAAMVTTGLSTRFLDAFFSRQFLTISLTHMYTTLLVFTYADLVQANRLCLRQQCSYLAMEMVATFA